MFISKQSIILAFIIGFVCTIIFPILFPHLNLLTLIPLIAIFSSRTTLKNALIMSILIGAIQDLLSIYYPMGYSSLNLLLTTLFLYRYRSYFYVEKPHTYTIYIFLFSLVSSSIQLLQLHFLGISINLSLISLMSNLILMPLLDAAYGLLFYFYPYILIRFLTHPKRVNFRKQIILKYRRKLLPWRKSDLRAL